MVIFTIQICKPIGGCKAIGSKVMIPAEGQVGRQVSPGDESYPLVRQAERGLVGRERWLRAILDRLGD